MIYPNPISSSNFANFPATLVDIVARAHKLKNRIEVQLPTLPFLIFILHTRASNFVNSMVQSATAMDLSAASRRIASEGLAEEIEDNPISYQVRTRFSLAGWFNN